MQRIQLRSRLAPAVMKARAGTGVTDADMQMLLTGPCDVYKPDGTPLVMFRPGAIPPEMCAEAYPTLHWIGQKYTTDNRGRYSGGHRWVSRKADGTPGKQVRTFDDEGNELEVHSAVIGYYDRVGRRFPYCRATAFTANEVAQWETLQPMIQHVARVFEHSAPERYAKQQALAAKCHPAWIIPNTPFSTLTVNNNVIGSIHTDKGDYKDGLGIISAVRRGQYDGAALVFPEFGIGAKLGDGDVIFFNSHDWHGVTPFENISEDHERISIVYYLREKITDCKSPAEELEGAKTREEAWI